MSNQQLPNISEAWREKTVHTRRAIPEVIPRSGSQQFLRTSPDLQPPRDPSRIPRLVPRRITLRQKKHGRDVITTTDPGRALITGKWADIGKLKGPILRALAARAPYFHNGSAADLKQVIDFYNVRFAMGLTDAEKTDLVAFLNAL